jgi:hypothetical protein
MPKTGGGNEPLRRRGTLARDCRFSPAMTRQEQRMPRSKMKGDNSADSKGHLDKKARGSGGTTKKSQNAGKQSNQKAANTKSNSQ